MSGCSSHCERDRDMVNHAVQHGATSRLAEPEELAEVIEVLSEQIGVLEGGLPTAPGMQRAALFKEIVAYRAALAAKQQQLRQRRCRDATSVNDTEDRVA